MIPDTSGIKIKVYAPSGPFSVICEDTSILPRPEWLALRKQGLGSSDVAASMALTPWSSPYALYCEKLNLVPEQDQSEFFAWKLELETPILNWVERKEWVKGPMRRHLMLRSVEYPFLLANPDGLTATEVVEAKTASAFDEKRWDEGLPDQYAIQAHVLMAVTGRRECFFPVMFDTKAPREFWVAWDPEVGEPMIEAATKFWRQIQDRIEPDPDHSEATMLALRERYYETIEKGKACQLPAEVIDLVRVRNTAEQIAKTNKEISDGVKAQLMNLLGHEDAEIGKVGDLTVCTWIKSEKTDKRSFLYKNIDKESAA